MRSEVDLRRVGLLRATTTTRRQPRLLLRSRLLVAEADGGRATGRLQHPRAVAVRHEVARVLPPRPRVVVVAGVAGVAALRLRAVEVDLRYTHHAASS
jgi:hypothetical protein